MTFDQQQRALMATLRDSWAERTAEPDLPFIPAPLETGTVTYRPDEFTCEHGKTFGPCPLCTELNNHEQHLRRIGP